MATYILWKYDGQWDEAEQKRIQYFMAAAMRRGYNKFILQMVFIKNPLKYKVGTVHMEIIFQLLKKEIKEFLQKVPDGNSILLKNELIMDSEVKEVTNVYGGFFLIATTVNNDHWVGA
jgi:hypothetical protein